MKRFRIFYFIETIGLGGDMLVLAETQEKAIEMFKKKIADDGNPDPTITEVREC